MKTRKWMTGMIVLGLLVTCGVQAYGETKFLCKAAIVKADESNHLHKRILLAPEVINYAREDLADLRIVNNDGEEIPYFMEEAHFGAKGSWETNALGSRTDETGVSYDFEVLGREIRGNTLVVTTEAENFSEEAEALGSYDGEIWEPLAKAVVYSVPDLGRRLSIDLPKPEDYTHYRIKLSAGAFEPVGVRLEGRPRPDRYSEFIAEIAPPFTIEEDGDESRIVVGDALQNLELLQVTLETKDEFRRAVSCDGNSGMLYNHTFGSYPVQDLTLGLGEMRGGKELVLTVQNEGETPLSIDKVVFTYQREALVFEARPKDTFELYFGDPSLEKPAYDDFEARRDKVLRTGVDDWSLGVVEKLSQPVEPKEEPKEKPKEKGSFGSMAVVLAAAVVCLGVYLLRRKASKK